MGATGIQVYNFSERPTRSSGFENTVWINTRKRPISMGIWTTMGPKQPKGLTPASRYRRMVSWETLERSLAYLSCISFSLGCRALMARICRSCFNVSGIVTKRMRAVNTMIAIPMLLKNKVYSTTRELSMGRIISSVQRNEMASKESYLAAAFVRLIFLVS